MTGRRITYDEFGHRFVRKSVTPVRVRDTVAAAAAGDMSTSIRLAGGLVNATGSGTVTDVDVRKTSDDPLAYVATIAASLDLLVRVAGVPYRYRASVAVPLQISVSTTSDLVLLIDIDEVGPSDVDLELRPAGTGGAVIDQIGRVGAQARREVAALVNTRINSPETMRTRVVAVAPAIDAEWDRLRS